MSTKLLHSLKESPGHDSYICSPSLIDFCREKRGPLSAFHIPLLTVYEVGKLITGLTSKKSMGPDNIPAYLLKLAHPYVVEPLTYFYNLCIQKNVFPEIFKTAKVIPLPKNTDRTDPNNFCCQFCQNLLKGMFTIICLLLWKNTTCFTPFNLDLDQSIHVTLLCLQCVICGCLLLIVPKL